MSELTRDVKRYFRLMSEFNAYALRDGRGCGVCNQDPSNKPTKNITKVKASKGWLRTKNLRSRER